MSDHDIYSTVVVRSASSQIRLGDDLLGGAICAASTGNLLEDYAALAAENARLRAELEQSRDLIVEMSKHCNATALVADWLERNT